MNRWLLVGLPNVGKSTIFNLLTKKNAHVGNWSGVTVKENKALVKLDKEYVEIVDLPGMYGLFPYSDEEKVSVDYLLANPDCVVINVISYLDIERGLRQTLALKELGYKVIVVLNFFKKARKSGVEIDLDKFRQSIACPVVINDEKNKVNLAIKIAECVDCKKINYDDSYLPKELVELIKNSTSIVSTYNSVCDFEKQKNNLDIIYKSRLTRVRQIISNCATLSIQKKIRIIPTYALFLLFTPLLGLGGWTIFGPIGNWLKSIIELFFEYCTEGIDNWLKVLDAPEWIVSFIGEVVCSGLGSVLGFLPQIALLFTFVELIEQSGLISRLVWVCTPVCYRLKISGRSIFPLLMGAGCNTTSIPLTSTIKNETYRKKTIMMLPYVPCSAKLPVLALVVGVFFKNYAFLVIIGLYLLSILIGGFSASILATPKGSFDVWEYGSLQFPQLRQVGRSVARSVIKFLTKIGNVLLIFAMVIWLGIHFSFRGEYLPTITEDSILCMFSKIIAPLFSPLGLDWGEVCALILGLPAKELALLGMAMLNGVKGENLAYSLSGGIVNFDILSALTFLTFFMLYTPCIRSIAQTREATSTRFALFLVVWQFIWAYIVSFFIHSCTKCVMMGGVGTFVWTISFGGGVLITILILLRSVFRKRKCGSCSNCSGCHG